MTDDLLNELRGAGRSRVRFLVVRRGRTVLPRLAEWCATDPGGLGVAALALELLEESVDWPDRQTVTDFAQAVARAAVRHGGEAGVRALYRVHALDPPGPHPPIGAEFLTSPDPELRLAAAVCSGRGAEVFGEFLADGTTGYLQRTVIRRAMDGRPDQIPMFLAAIGPDRAPAVRSRNLGECRRIIEDWRPAPARFAPVLAALLTEAPIGVRPAAMNALRSAGAATGDHLDVISDFYRATGSSSALATLIAGRRPEAVEALREFLAAPHPFGSVQGYLEDATWCAAEIADDVAGHLRARREVPAILHALRRRWGATAAPLIPALVDLHAAGVEQNAITEILAGIGPAVVAAEELLVTEMRDTTNDRVRRIQAAVALLRCGSTVDEAVAVLMAEFDHPVAQRYLAEQDPPLPIPKGLADGAVTAYRSRLRWLSGDRDPQLAADLMNRFLVLAGGLRELAWLAGTGDLIRPHLPALTALRDDPRRPFPSRSVREDERLVSVLTDLVPGPAPADPR
ncbi:hypothetical protein [Actinoplanes couchii]|uniref:HEAT repeat domain-containing protein n=1 Tax=Actinoplanes couchii TaxID=403638 RepID=A0ABQ3X8Y7_9ACTN|nr:hypothetical protein [Actinoplanes couchii]MDR6325869.1 hypothetical protein [Actinoplanes couchii]GID54962.1 hypothetical protein Aco03nite_033660 [Actinoplanes couchii]